MKLIIKRTGIILLSILSVWLVLSFVILRWNKSEIHLFINDFHSGFFDNFFRIVTFFGDGLMPVILAVLYCFLLFRKALVLLLSGVLAGLFAQILKRFVFPDSPRPKAFFEGIADIYFVPGVEVHSHHSFPSGHSATVFALFMAMAFFSEKKLHQYIFFAIALLTGFSRVYLSQHFLVDVYFGALTGVISAIIVLLIFVPLRAAWLDNSILKIKNTRNE